MQQKQASFTINAVFFRRKSSDDFSLRREHSFTTTIHENVMPEAQTILKELSETYHYRPSDMASAEPDILNFFSHLEIMRVEATAALRVMELYPCGKVRFL